MRKYFILLILTIFFAGVTYYLLQTLNPFDMSKLGELASTQHITVAEELQQVEMELIQKGLILEYIDIRHLLIILLVGSFSVISGFTFVHLIIEKVVFRKFYQHPSIFTAIRRGVFLCAGIITAILYRLYAAEVYLTVVTWVLLLALEIIITRVLAKPPKEEGSEEEKSNRSSHAELVSASNQNEFPKQVRDENGIDS